MRLRHYTGFSTTGAIGALLAALITAGGLTGCQDTTNSSGSPSQSAETTPFPYGINVKSVTDELSRRLGISPDQVNAALGPHSEALQAKTKEEVDKLFRWEYRVQDLPSPIPAEEFERRLGELGSDGWDCFSIAQEVRSIRLTCKRRPKSAITYLKYLPGL